MAKNVQFQQKIWLLNRFKALLVTTMNALQTSEPNHNTEIEIPANLDEQQPEITSNPPLPNELQNATEEISQTDGMSSQSTTPDPRHELRRSTQIRKVPIRYGNPVPHWFCIINVFNVHCLIYHEF